MQRLNTPQRRRLLAASVRLERAIRRDHALPPLVARRRLVKLLERQQPWPWHAV